MVISEQITFAGSGTVDKNMMPVNSVSDLSSIPLAQRYEGMTVTVLNKDITGGVPTEYWLVGGTRNPYWRVKRSNTTVATRAELDLLKKQEIYVGLEVVVLADESISGSPISKYWITNIENGVATWERKNYGTDMLSDVESVVDMLINKKFGNVVYTTDKVYSYIDSTDATRWTSDKAEAEAQKKEGTEITEYSDGLYAIKKEGEDTVFSKISTDDDTNIHISGEDVETV